MTPCGIRDRSAWAKSVKPVVTAFALMLAVSGNAQTLGKALEQAWSRHPQASAVGAREAEAQAQAEVAASLTPQPPSLSLSTLGDRLNNNRGKQEWEVEMAFPLWLPGQKAAHELEADRAVAEVAARHAALRLQVAGEVRDAWWAVAAARNALALAERREATARALESDVLRRFKAGEMARVDANLAQNERLAAASEVLEVRSAQRQAEQIYRGLTGSDAPSVLTEETPAPMRGALGKTRKDAENLRNDGELHPQLAAALAAAQVARARLKVAEETRREAPEFAVRMVRERGDFGEPYANTVGVKLTVPFSSAARVRRESSAALAETTQADAELALIEQRIELDIARARLDHDAAEQQLNRAQTRHDLTADNLRLAEKSFALGESDLPTLLRARSSAFEAEASLDRQRAARGASVSRLNQTLGVLP